MSQQRLSIRLSGELHEKLDALIPILGKSESQIVREALEEFCSKRLSQPTCYEAAKRLGLIGCAEGLPADLSTNEEHMARFGRE